MAINVFTVLSEFRFDVGSAVVGSQQLQNSVDGISDAASRAQDSLSGIGIGLLKTLSGGQAGLLGLLGSALSTTDKFQQSQISFASIIDSNMEHLTGSIHGMNEQMMASRKIMNDIAKDAQVFGLPADELKEMTKTLSAMLVPKGLAGENFGNARTMSRNLLKSAPNLGINPADVQGQLLRSIEGSASMGDTLFRRLLTEAPESFKEAKVKDVKSFNTLDAAKRFGILNEALGKFASNAGLLTARANTLSGIMQRVKDLFGSFNSVLRPLGEVIMPLLIQVMNMAIRWIDTKGRELVKVMSVFLKQFIDEPKEMLVDLAQVQALGGDFKKSVGLTGLVITLMHLKEALHFLGKIPVVGKMFSWLAEIPLLRGFMTGVGAAFRGLGSALVYLWPLIKIAAWGIASFAGWVAVFLIPLQGLSRALARMKIDTLEWFADNLASLSNTFLSLQHSLGLLWSPIQDMIVGFEELFYAILGGDYVLDLLKSSFESFTGWLRIAAVGFNELYAGFRGLVAGMMDVFFRAAENVGIIFDNLSSGNLLNPMEGTKNIFGGYMEAGSEEFAKIISRSTAPMVDGEVDNAKVSNSVNNYDVKMQNNFKEVLQPDRIAFTIKDQLEKASSNRTSGRVTSVAGRQAQAI